MANRPNIPKFGEWNNQDQQFTAVFNNARSNKRADLYENSDIKPQARAPPPPSHPSQRDPRPVRNDTPRAPPPRERKKVRAPPAEELSGGRGRGGVYGGCGGGGGSGNQWQPQARRPVQHIPNLRGGSNGKGVTIPPFPGSVGAGENISYTQIFEQVKDERREGFRSSGESAGTTPTPSRPINGHNQSPKPKSSSMVCCFSWCRKGSKY